MLNEEHIKNADLICFPPGSFYTSVIANLLPKGVGSAVYSNKNAPKVYVPNLGQDNEQYGMCLEECIETIIRYLNKDIERSIRASDLISHILMDADSSLYSGTLSQSFLSRTGIKAIKLPLVTSGSAPYYEPTRLAQGLAALA